jgi:hypothetical protein
VLRLLSMEAYGSKSDAIPIRILDAATSWKCTSADRPGAPTLKKPGEVMVALGGPSEAFRRHIGTPTPRIYIEALAKDFATALNVQFLQYIMNVVFDSRIA